MAITYAEVKSQQLHVYGEKNKTLYMHAMSPSDKLLGFTANSVTVKKGQYTITYDEKGKTISTHHTP
ncbi:MULTISPECIES: hypothetical protein [Helicobacter]|nr:MULTISPECIES: hypothetical protein [Helicobacter]GLH58597.1 hypothetical protein NHP214376_13900 [Helicobacter ailurogastricus]GLH60114.1 hypothetical protein NHP214377_13870 [Helicobacter ailurogastricus]